MAADTRTTGPWAPPVVRRRAGAVKLLPNAPHQFLRLLASTPKIARRRLHRSAIAVAPSFRPPLRTSVKRVLPIQSQTPSPTCEAEAPKEPRRPEAEERSSADAAAAEAVAGKYWPHRRSLFSLQDRGVRMDAECWYPATPEAVAAAQAARAAPAALVVDAFAGVGGNSIQFAARKIKKQDGGCSSNCKQPTVTSVCRKMLAVCCLTGYLKLLLEEI